MGLLASLLAVACLGVDGPSDRNVGYQVRMVEIQGLDWRAESHDRLTPVTRQGGATIWTAPRALAPVLEEKAVRTTAFPKVSANNGQGTLAGPAIRHAYIADLKRQAADDPDNQAASAGWFEPEIDHVEEKLAIQLEGSWVDQGLMAQVAIEEQRLAALHSVVVHGETRAVERDGLHKYRRDVPIQVPEVIQTQVSGSWLIPNGELLIVSLGTHTQPNFDGEPVIIEKLAIIEPSQAAKADRAIVPAAETSSKSDTLNPNSALPMTMIGGASQLAAALSMGPNSPVSCEVAPPKREQEVTLQAPVSPSPLANARIKARPQPPSRVLPTPINHKGEVVPLPPLPEDAGPIISDSESQSGVPRPAPQSRLRDRQKAAAAAGLVVPSSTEPLPEAKVPPTDPLPEAKAPARTTSEAQPNMPRATAGQVQLTLGFGPRGVALSGQLRLARGEVGSPEAIQALKTLVNTWAVEAQKRLTTTIGIAPETSDRSINQEIVAALERFAHESQGGEGPQFIFGLRGYDSQGRLGHVAISIEANEAGREWLRRNELAGLTITVPAVGKRDLATLQTSAELSSLEAHPNGSDAAPLPPKLRDIAAAPQSGQPEVSRTGSDRRGDWVRAVVLGAGVVPSPLIFEAKPGLLDQAVQPASFMAEGAPIRARFGLSPVPVCPVFQADPLLIRVPVGRLGMIEVCPVGSRPSGLGLSW